MGLIQSQYKPRRGGRNFERPPGARGRGGRARRFGSALGGPGGLLFQGRFQPGFLGFGGFQLLRRLGGGGLGFGRAATAASAAACLEGSDSFAALALAVTSAVSCSIWALPVSSVFLAVASA